jgi:hypothetical protein
MGLVRGIESLEDWLDGHAACWLRLSDREYVVLVRQWTSSFVPLIEADAPSRRGHRAFEEFQTRLPCEVVLFSGVKVPRLANEGGHGPSVYHVFGLQSLDRVLANKLELVVAPVDFAWCFVFSHEAGFLVWETLFELR